MSNLEEIFNNSLKNQLTKEKSWEEKKIDRWNKDLEACNSIFEQVSFLNKHGKIIEKVCCTPYNKSDADRGFYPYLRVPSQLACFRPIHDSEKKLGTSGGTLEGTYTLEEFAKKMGTIFRLK